MSKKLSPTAVANARAYLFTNGRLLDQRLYAFHFEGGSKTAVFDALAPYQNDDGGFGQALEPDLRTPDSSAIATSQAFAIFRDVGATAEEPMVQRAIAYLLASFDAEREVWPIAPPTVDNAPRAFWWAAADLAHNFAGFRLNPFATLVGHLHHFAPQVPPDFLARVTAVALERLAEAADELGMYDLFCYMGLATAGNLPAATKATIKTALAAAVPRLVEPDPQQWGNHTLRPLDVVAAPDALLVDVVAETAVQAHLDYLIDTQLADGSWLVPWSWAALDAAAWAQAEQDWKGHIAVQNLRALQAFGRLGATNES